MLQASEALALAKAGRWFSFGTHTTHLWKKAKFVGSWGFLQLCSRVLLLCALHMLYIIIYIADIDAVNMEFLVCWNLDRKISEVSSCPSHCFGRSRILHGFVVCPPKGSVDNWMTPKIQSKIQGFIGSSHQRIRPCGLTKSYQTLCDVVMSHGNPNAS